MHEPVEALSAEVSAPTLAPTATTPLSTMPFKIWKSLQELLLMPRELGAALSLSRAIAHRAQDEGLDGAPRTPRS